MQLKYFSLLLVLIVAAAFVGCEGPEGPQGEQGPAGPINAGYSYLGGNSCDHCHASTVAAWAATGHHEAYDALVAGGDENNLYCVQCHTTGFDAVVSYGDTIVNTPGPDLSGFDDYWPPANAEDSMRVENLKNVNCEACHGPMGPEIYECDPIINFETLVVGGVEQSMCVKCHEQVEEWHESGHGMALENAGLTQEEWNDEFNAGGSPTSTSTCWTCHTSEGFAYANDTDWTGTIRPEMATLIGCPSCHDPHSSAKEAQLRNLNDYTTVYTTSNTATYTGYGTSQICVQCHHARRDNNNVANQIANGTEHFGPHGSPQMDTFLGSGCYEITGYTYDRTHSHQTAPEGCVTCHMEFRDHSNPLGWKGGHDFEPTPATCQTTGCHGAMPADFDVDGVVTLINSKMQELLDLIGVPVDSLGSASLTVALREAGYAYIFLYNDGSHGIHNPAYALSLLNNAIDYLTPNAVTDAGAKRTK